MFSRILTLCLLNFTICSRKICQENCKDLFTLLINNEFYGIIKTNILIAIADLYHRFPDIIEPQINKLYCALKDSSSSVKKTCLMVITHLVLNDLMKIKPEVEEIVKLIEDPDEKIQN